MFWGTNVDSEAPFYSITLPHDLRITHASLSSTAKEAGRNILFVLVNDKKHALCSLSLGATEHVALNVFFSQGTNLKLTTVGPEKISVW